MVTRTTFRRGVGGLLLTAVGCLFVAVKADSGHQSPVIAARGVVLPIFATNFTQRIATLKVARIYAEHRRIGFFSVKLLPVVVVEDASFEINDRHESVRALAGLGAKLKDLGGGRGVEVRGLTVMISGQTVPRLSVRRLVPSSQPGRFDLEGAQVWLSGRSIELPEAAWLDGRAGRVFWSTPARQEISFDLIGGTFTTNQLTHSALTQ